MSDSSYGFAKLFGIGIELHWTFIALMLITFLLSPYAFVLIALLFMCVFVHELFHCIVSIRNGVKVRKIILLPIGGASVIDDVNISPKVEFNIAIAGPLVSLLLGAIFGVFVVVAPPGFANQVLQYLFEINILLGVFNLLPAFPTDGGRVFRSYLERRYDSYKATVLTIKASKYVMAAFLIGTVAFVFMIQAPEYYKEFVFLWNMLVIFFLYGGAEAEQDMNEIRKASAGVMLKDVLSKHYRLVKPQTSIRELYNLVKTSKVHIMLTTLGEGYAYIDLIDKKSIKGAKVARDAAVSIPSIKINDGIVDALELMQSSETGILAVVRGRDLAGIVTMPHIRTFLSLHMLHKKRA
jgi:Zn-dependent protease